MKNKPEPKNDGDNFNLLPPPSPPPPPPPLGPQPLQMLLGPPPAPLFFPSTSGRFLEPFQWPTAQPRPQPPLKPIGFIGIPPAPSAVSLSPSDYFPLGPSARSVSSAPRPLTPTAPSLSPLPFTLSNNLYGSQTQTLTREKEEIKNAVQKELDDKIYELPDDPPKLELGDVLANILGPGAEDILNERFVNEKKLKDEFLENIKEEYGFEQIKDGFDEDSVPHQLEFFCDGINENFIQVCYLLSSNNNNNREFIAFLESAEDLMTNNSLSIHAESGSTFYQNFNTNENFYSFFISQQDETKARILKRISSPLQLWKIYQ